MTGPRIGSLCSGYGGLDIAVEAVTGASTAWFCEYDRDPSLILAHHWPDVPNHGDVKHTDWSQVEPVDILTAGYPCQPFSHAGKRKGTDDPRHLWPDVARAIGALRPGLVVLENVAGHVSLGLADVLGDLSALGYDATWGVVRAADAGAPHGRARIFICASDWNADGQPGAKVGAVRGGPDAEPSRAGGAAPDAGSRPLARTAAAGHGLPVAAERGHFTTADASSERHGRVVHPGDMGRVDGEDAGRARERERSREVTVDRGATTAADPAGWGWEGVGVEEPARIGGTPRREPDGRATAWGQYDAAIRRWEAVIGRPAPDPTEPGRNGRPRLSPAFVEWMQGLDPGHVTDPAIGISRNAQLKALGNGVVPQQAALALRLLMGVDRAVSA